MKIMIKKFSMQLVAIVLLMLHISCKKFLDEKPDKRIGEPKSLDDANALLNNYITMNFQFPNTGLESDDDFYLTDVYFNSLAENPQDTYKWQPDIETDLGWRNMYVMVLYANVALEVVEDLSVTVFNEKRRNELQGMALFFRSLAFYELAQYYARPYDAASAAGTAGIPLRLASEVNTAVNRSSLQATYDEILGSTKAAVALLPDTTFPVSRPSRAAAHALLANVYLSMRNYEQAGLYADSAFRLHSELLNYNTISTTSNTPFAQFNNEVLFSAAIAGLARLNQTNLKVDSLLYRSYHVNDLRRTLFFRQTGGPSEFGFKGNYQSNTYGGLFMGFATDELLLIRAEAAARANNKTAAIDDLNRLLITRFKTGTYVPYVADSVADVLSLVLTERRKELVGRGRRWFDLRRLNQEPGRERTLTRLVNNVTYLLPPNDNRYTFYIPQITIDQTGIQQNQR